MPANIAIGYFEKKNYLFFSSWKSKNSKSITVEKIIISLTQNEKHVTWKNKSTEPYIEYNLFHIQKCKKRKMI